jgi:hypothetical protein
MGTQYRAIWFNRDSEISIGKYAQMDHTFKGDLH